MRLDVKDFKLADLLLDRILEANVRLIYLGKKELRDLDLEGKLRPTFFDIPVQKVDKDSYIALETDG